MFSVFAEVGPELWRLGVPDARRARAWVQGWVELEAPVSNACRMRIGAVSLKRPLFMGAGSFLGVFFGHFEGLIYEQ